MGNVHALQHRLTAVIVSLAITGAFVLCCLGGFSCSFVQVTAGNSANVSANDGDDDDNNNILVTSWGEEVPVSQASLGVNCFSDYGNNVDVAAPPPSSSSSSSSLWSSTLSLYDESDRMWNLSRIFFFCGVACGGLTTVWSWTLSTFVAPTPCRWRFLSVMTAVAAVLQVPIFLILESETCTNDINRQSCSLSTGAYFNIASVGLWILVTICTQCLDPPRWYHNKFDDVWKTVTHVRPTRSSSAVKTLDDTTTGGGGYTATDGTSTEGGTTGSAAGGDFALPSTSFSPPTIISHEIDDENDDDRQGRGQHPYGRLDHPNSCRQGYQNHQQQQQLLQNLPELLPYPRSTSLLDQNEYYPSVDREVERGDLAYDIEGGDLISLPFNHVQRPQTQNDMKTNNMNDTGGAKTMNPMQMKNGGGYEDDNDMSPSDREIFDGINLCQGFRVETNMFSPGGGGKSKSSHQSIVGKSATGIDGGNGCGVGEGVRLTCVYSDGARHKTRLPSCIDMTGKVKSVCPLNDGAALIDAAGDWVFGGEENESMKMDYLTNRMRSDIVAGAGEGRGQKAKAPIDMIEIEMMHPVKSTIGLKGVDDDRSASSRGQVTMREDVGVHRGNQADDISEITKGSGLTTTVSDILDSGHNGTVSILEDLARTY